MDALHIRLWHDVVWCAIAKYYPQRYILYIGVKSKLLHRTGRVYILYNVICENMSLGIYFIDPYEVRAKDWRNEKLKPKVVYYVTSLTVTILFNSPKF